MILADFHIHSNFSDGRHSIPEIVDFYGTRGFGAIAITDHLCETETFLGKAASYLERTLTLATFPLYLEILRSETQRAWDQYRMIIIPGYEITKNTFSNHRSAHVIGLGVNEYVPADGSIESILKAIRNQGALTIAAHPVSNGKLEKQTLHLWSRRKELASLFDAWEVGSGKSFYREVAESKLPMIASTDLHRFSQMSAWKTIVDAEKHPEAILDAIRKQQVTFHYYEESHGVVPLPQHLDVFSMGDRSGHLDLISSA